MYIQGVEVIQETEFNQLSGQCGDFNLWYRFPKHIDPLYRADPFLAACLIPSMLLGEDIIIDDQLPVSPKLLTNLETLQDIFLLWGPHFGKNLRRIRIKGGIPTPAADDTNNATVSFFSGGVDGTHTFLKNHHQIDYLLFSKGIDMQLDNNTQYQAALEKNREFLRTYEKEIYPIETNVRFFGHEFGLSWTICFGGGLSSIALAGNFSRCFIASGVCYGDMHPEGSLFVSDYLWSNEHTKIVHDGAEARRIDKIRAIAEHPGVLDIIRVCWQDKGYNCGKCEKCLRTMASLRALNIKAATFPECTDDIVQNHIANLKLYNPHDYAFLNENLVVAEANGDKVLVKALNQVKRNFQLRQAFRLIDDSCFGNRLSKLLSRGQ